MLGTIDRELIIYDFKMINCKIKERFFIIYDLLKETIIYYKEQIKFDIVKIKRYNMIFEMLQLYEYNLQIDWIIGLISIIWHYKNRSILIKRDLAIEDIYKEWDINKFIQTIKILNLINIFSPVDIIFEEY